MLERDLRNMATVMRWGIVPTTRQQNLAEHSYFVTMYANDICLMAGVTDEIRLSVLKSALGHDLDEIFTCDVPGPHKRHVMIANSNWLHKAMEKVFEYKAQRWGSKIDHLALVKTIVKVADILESVLYLIEEMRMGNTNVAEHEAVLFAKLGEMLDRLDSITDALSFSRVKNRVIDKVHEARWMPMQNSRITYDEED